MPISVLFNPKCESIRLQPVHLSSEGITRNFYTHEYSITSGHEPPSSERTHIMDETVNITLILAGYLYFGSLAQWREYARVLTVGRVAAYRRSPAYGNQSLQNFFELFRRSWKKSTTPPGPEEYGIIPMRSENLTQNQIIDELLK
jgi:hypothetical protein